MNDLLDAHLRLYVQARQLRSEKQISRSFDRYVRPAIGRMRIRDLKRSHIVGLLDSIASRNAPVMADRVLAYLRKALNWHAARDDNFVVPIVRGMGHTNPKERARDRILSDNEIRALWKATEPCGSDPYRPFVRVLLLTAQRRQEVAGMRWSEIEGDIWTVPGERMKRRRDHLVVLSDTTLSLLGTLPYFGVFVFGRAGATPFSGFSKSKRLLDDRMRPALGTAAAAPPSKPWTHHDLRRTARSLMARAGVRPDIAERVLNHAVSGMQAVYDRYDYAPEQRLALVALERLVLQIVGIGSAATVRPAALPPPAMAPTAPSAANVTH